MTTTTSTVPHLYRALEVFAEQDGDEWVVWVPALPGCITQVGHKLEALRYAQECMEDLLAVYRDDGVAVPWRDNYARDEGGLVGWVVAEE